MTIISLTDAKTHLQLVSDDIAFNAALQKIVDKVNTKISLYLRKDILVADRVEYCDGNGQYLKVSVVPVNTVSKIEVYKIEDKAWSELVLNTDYDRLIEVYGLIKLEGYVIIEGSQNYKLTYNGGIATTSQDYTNIKNTCLDLLVVYYNQSALGAGTFGLKSFSSSRSGFNETKTFDDKLEDKVLSGLDRYRPHYV
jgi:hypothetical protein